MAKRLEVLHQQTGLRIRRNRDNGFVVATLHFTADPRKRSAEWIKESKQGIPLAKWEREYNISYDSMLGEKVFPEIKDRAGEIVVSQGPFINDEWPRSIPMWGGFDYGQRNPSSFHVYTYHDGVTYAIWEMYEPCKNIVAFAKAMKECPYWDQVKYIACDPNLEKMTISSTKNGGGLQSTLQQFAELGVTKFQRGIQDEAAWLQIMQKHWCEPEVTFKILTCCPKMIEEFEGATFVSMTEKQLVDHNFKEQMVDKRNHALDDCKYFMNSRPNFKTRKVELPSLAYNYGWHGDAPRQKDPRRREWLFLQ